VARPAVRTQKSAIAEYWLGTRQGRARLPDNAAVPAYVSNVPEYVV
jgi:hypothetical protein